MNFNDSISAAYKNYLNPRGRASRSAYWYFILFVVLIMVLVTVGATIIAANLAPDNADNTAIAGLVEISTLIVVGIYIFGFGIPALMLMVRRFHDVGLSGIFVFIIFFSGVGARVYSDFLVSNGAENQSNIYLAIANLVSLAGLIVTLWPSQAGPNKYGPPAIN